jgi:hypothetical protein
LAVIGARCQLLKDQGQIGRARRVFEQAICDGGFADHYPLIDLLSIAREWSRPLITKFLESADTQPGTVAVPPRLQAVGRHGVSIPVYADGQQLIVNVPALETTGSKTLALNFWCDAVSEEAVRLRIRAIETASAMSLYDQEFRMRPRGYQAVVIPVAGRSSIALQLTTSSESAHARAREIHCIAPLLFNEE